MQTNTVKRKKKLLQIITANSLALKTYLNIRLN